MSLLSLPTMRTCFELCSVLASIDIGGFNQRVAWLVKKSWGSWKTSHTARAELLSVLAIQIINHNSFCVKRTHSTKGVFSHGFICNWPGFCELCKAEQSLSASKWIASEVWKSKSYQSSFCRKLVTSINCLQCWMDNTGTCCHGNKCMLQVQLIFPLFHNLQFSSI